MIIPLIIILSMSHPSPKAIVSCGQKKHPSDAYPSYPNREDFPPDSTELKITGGSLWKKGAKYLSYHFEV